VTYHIFYFIILLIDGKYKGIYGGIHSTKNINDNYLGSGTFLKKLQKEYGEKNFIKFDKFFFESREELIQYEKKIINKKWISSPYSINKVIGGNSSINIKNIPYTAEQRIEILEKKLEKELKIYNSDLD